MMSRPLPRPFLKWAGGKRQLLSEILPQIPQSRGTYHEPFLGGGALFFKLQPERAVLADLNERLVRTYRAVRDDVESVILALQECKNDKDFYLRTRARDIDAASNVELAAWFIFLNKTGFNGLYRVNKKGKFNVPFGAYKNPLICDVDNLRACSQALAGVKILHTDFRHVEEMTEPGDFVYFDPPYVPLSATASFTSYTRDGFTIEDQTELRDIAKALKHKRVHVLLSNSSTAVVHELYAEGFERKEVYATRAINSDGAKRGKVAEALIW
jgi:DNA adenine methylase